MDVREVDIDIQELIIDQLAFIRARDRAEIARLVEEAGGDLEIDSKEGQVVAINIEIRLDLPGLIRPEDQEPEHLTTISSLTALISRRQAAYRDRH